MLNPSQVLQPLRSRLIRCASLIVLGISGLLVACSDGASIQAPIPVPGTPAQFNALPAAKSVALSWTASQDASYYIVLEDLDGPAGPQPAREVARVTDLQWVQAISQLLSAQLQISYAVQAYSASGCSAPTAWAAADFTQSVGYLKASNTQAGDLFGFAVALSQDGQSLLVGADREDSAATGLGGNLQDNSALNAGAAYLY